jgi:DNA-binding NarL/FixJ family response regulator
MTSTTETSLARRDTDPASSLVKFPAMNLTRTGAIRLFIIDGRPLVRWALAHIADDASDLVTIGHADHADHAMKARELAVAGQADVVTIDCSLPDGQGWQLARDLRDRHPELGIVLLIAEGSDDLLFRALDSGASAYLPKDAPVHEVLSAIRHSAVAASSFSAAGLAQALRRRRDATDSVLLSPREIQVLALLREGRSVPEVATTLYVSLSTAKTYVARLYEKHGAKNRSQALMTAVQLGLFDDNDSMVS